MYGPQTAIDWMRNGDFGLLENDNVRSWMKRRGHDSYFVTEGEGQPLNLAVFKPEQVKSSIGNQGTFDPSDPDMNRAAGGRVYPMADRSEWYGDANYQQTGGQIEHMSPDEYLSKVRPLDIDDASRDNIDDLKQHIVSGRKLDPLKIDAKGREDGRHRAHAAKELGIKSVPVLTWPRDARAAGGYVPQTRLSATPQLAVAQPAAPAQSQGPSTLDKMTQLAGAFKGDEAAPTEQVPSAATEGHPGVSASAQAALDALRKGWTGQSFDIVSDYRDPAENQRVGGAKGSQHLGGNAFDINTAGWSPEDKLALATQAYNSGFRGFGFYDNNLHFDVGGQRAWGPSYHQDSIPDWARGWAEQYVYRPARADGGKVDNFQNWFGNSVTHTNGEPHVFYTGTSKDKDFTGFNVGRHGAWFTRDPEIASQYAENNDSQGHVYDGGRYVPVNTASRVIPAYVKAEKPYTGEYSGRISGNYKKDQSDWFDTLRAKGHDAWIPESSQGQLVVALKEPQQIKSIYNNGKFDPNQKHMGKAEGGEVENEQTTPGNRQIGTQTQGLLGPGGVQGSAGVLPSPVQASGEADLTGLPTTVKMPKLGQTITAGHDPRVRQVARDYAKTSGIPYNPPTVYRKVDPDRAKRIADAYDAMPHDPHNPLVKASYDAMLRETLGQYQAMKKAGVKMEFYRDPTDDPYKSNPRLAVEDIRKNNHMFVYPTDAGYGTGDSMPGLDEHPMLGDSGERWNGKPVLFNDLFRAVHDYFGHAKEGVGFRADGEDNAWRQHAAMFSPLARIALGTETRGQNSWLNYGPHGANNRTAATEDTVFAPQKLGVLPHWVHHEGAEDFIPPHEREAMADIYKKHGFKRGGAVDAALGLTRRFTKGANGAMLSLKIKGN